VIFTVPDFSFSDEIPQTKDLPVWGNQSPHTLVLGSSENAVDLSGHSVRFGYKKKMAQTWSLVSPMPIITPGQPAAWGSQITVDLDNAALNGSSAENYREYTLEMRNGTSNWKTVL